MAEELITGLEARADSASMATVHLAGEAEPLVQAVPVAVAAAPVHQGMAAALLVQLQVPGLQPMAAMAAPAVPVLLMAAQGVVMVAVAVAAVDLAVLLEVAAPAPRDW